MSTISIEEKLLIVEGKDDINFFNALSKYLGINNYQIKPTNGISNYNSKISAIWKEYVLKSIVNSIGIVRDANNNFDGTFQSVQTALKNSDLPVPRKPLLPAINQDTGLRVNVFIMPDNGSRGILEDLLLLSVNENPAMPCVNEYFNCLTEIGIDPKNMSKARTQTYLAAQIECSMSIGVAAQKDYWPFSHESFLDICDFLKSL